MGNSEGCVCNSSERQVKKKVDIGFWRSSQEEKQTNIHDNIIECFYSTYWDQALF